MIDLDEIERLARAATPGPWFHCQPFQTVPAVRTIHGPVPGQRVDYVAREPAPVHRPAIIPMEGRETTTRSHDMAFIAAANPATILALVARLRAAEAALHPFAWAAEDLDDNESGELWERPAAMSIECAHLRAAAAYFAAQAA